MGKSWLVESALAGIDLVVCHGLALEDSASPYHPLVSALGDCLRTLGDSSSALEKYLPTLANLLPELGPPDAEADEDQLREAIVVPFRALARNTPVAIFLDDLHWADNATLEFLPHLVAALKGNAVTVVGTYRTDEIGRSHPIRKLRDSLRRARQLEEISLAPFDRESAASLVSHLLGGPVSEAILELLCERSQGIPLYLEELTRALQAGDSLQQRDGRFVLRQSGGLPIPESIRDAVSVRLEKLGPEAQTAAEAAAVAGSAFDLSTVAALIGDDAGLEVLLEAQLLHETTSGSAAFRHTLIRDVIREEVTWSIRRSLHARLAEILEQQGADPHLIGDHWLQAGKQEAARRAFLAAAERSCRLHAYRDAATAADKALDNWPDGDDEENRVGALRRLAHCAQVSGNLNDAVRAWREAAESGIVKNDPEQLADVQRGLATVYGLQARWDQAIPARLGAIEAALSAGRPADAALDWLVVAGRYTAALRLDEAVRATEQAAILGHEAERPDIEARAIGLKGNVIAMQGRFEEGQETVRKGLTLALKHDQTEAASEIYRRLASALEYSSDYRRATEAYSSALDFCRSHGADTMAHVCLGCMSATLYQMGDWKRAVEVSREVLKSKASPPGSRAVGELIIGLISACRGETKTARKHLDAALQLAGQLAIAPVELGVYWGLAVMANANGDSEGATRQFATLLDRWQQTQDRHDAVPALGTAASHFAAQHMAAEAARCSDAMAAITAEAGNAESLATLALTLGEVAVANGDLGSAIESFRQSLDHYSLTQIPLEQARAEHRLGTVLADAREVDTATGHLQNAYRAFRKLGARPYAAQVADELRRLGQPVEEPRQENAPARAERAGLTRRQAEIVRLMADGLTNREIAGRLFLSTRTVDMHVANALSRLDCRTRSEAVRRAADMGLLPTAE